MLDATISWVAIVVAAAAAMAIRAVWYSKAVFGTKWQKLVNLTDKQVRENFAGTMIGSTLLALLMAFFMAKLISQLQQITWLDGAITGLWVWVGFVMTVTLVNVLYQKRGKKVFLINSGYWLITFVVMGAILAAWR